MSLCKKNNKKAAPEMNAAFRLTNELNLELFENENDLSLLLSFYLKPVG